MKKGKNITLLIGITCVSTGAVWQVIKTIFHYFSILNEDRYKHFLALDILPIAVIFLFMIFPIVLLIRNFKNKTGKSLPIISIIISGAVLLWVLFLSFTPTIPQYLIYSKLGIVDTYFTVVLSFLENGGLLFVVGSAALLIGSFLSLPNKKKQKTVDDQNVSLSDN